MRHQVNSYITRMLQAADDMPNFWFPKVLVLVTEVVEEQIKVGAAWN